MTLEDEENYQNSMDCWICTNKIIDNNDKVRDHCHITGKYRGTGHRSCNCKLKISKMLPNFAHNLQGYDGHLIFRELHKYEKIEVIPKSIEKYMTIMVNKNIFFLDSMQCLSASLDTLAKNLTNDDFIYSKKEFSNIDIEEIRRKNNYPYDWVKSHRNFWYLELPPKEAFFPSLKANQRGEGDGHISDEDYLWEKNAWKELGFKTFKDSQDYYLKKDVTLLTNLFENFIQTSLEILN